MMNNNNSITEQSTLPLLAKLALAVTIVFWASGFVGLRVDLQVFHPVELALVRYGIASLVMAGIYLFIPNKTRPRRGDWLWFLLLGLTGFSFYNAALGYGEEGLSAGLACFIVGMNPVTTILLATVFLGERISRLGWLGISVSVLGMGCIAAAEAAGIPHLKDVLYTFMATLSFSVYSVAQKPLLARYRSMELVIFAIWAGTLCLLPFSVPAYHEVMHAGLGPLLWIAYLGIFPGALAYVTWSYALKQGPLRKVVSSIYFAPFVATLMSWAMLGEVPHSIALLGGVIAIIGAVMVNISK